MKGSGKMSDSRFSRRVFLKATAATSIAASLPNMSKAYAAGSDKIRLGVIGCGGRGFYDSSQCLRADAGVELVAMGDLFEDRLAGTRAALKAEFDMQTDDDGNVSPKSNTRINVTSETSFVGFDAYKKVLACDIDLVILTQPPGFRPMHLRAAIEAGKHVFMEKPAAVDPVGIRSVIASAELADKKGLTIVAGTQARRMSNRMEVIKRIHRGDIGEIVAGQCVRIGGGMLGWGATDDPQWSEMERQIRRWLFYTWLSGDFIAEMHVHELDVVNWVMGGPPIKCTGMGGREVRKDKKYGNSYDHFSAEFEYANGARIAYMGAQIDGMSVRTNENFQGTKGSAYTDWSQSYITGAKAYKYEGEVPDPCVRGHADQIAAMRNGTKLNEGKRIAESSLTAIMGRMCAYTGRAMKWKWVMNASQLDLSPAKYEFGDLPPLEIAVPGKTPLV